MRSLARPFARSLVRIHARNHARTATMFPLRAMTAIAAAVLLAACGGGGGDGGGGVTPPPPPATMPDLSAKASGDYQGSYTIALPAGAIAMSRRWEVTVTVDASHAMSAIAVDYPASYPDEGMIDTLKARVLAAQSLDVDAFSGATYSSKAFLKAVEDALSD